MIYYDYSARSWMTEFIFKNWFLDILIPDLEKHFGTTDFEAVILLDNCTAHPKIVDDFDPRIFVKFLPPNCTALIQPMDQTAIATFKTLYKRLYYEEMVAFVTKSSIENPADAFVKEYSLLDAIKNIGKAWDMVKRETIQKSFNKVLDKELMVNRYKARVENEEDFTGFIDKSEFIVENPCINNISAIQKILNEAMGENFTIKDIEDDAYFDPDNTDVVEVVEDIFVNNNTKDDEIEETVNTPLTSPSSDLKENLSMICELQKMMSSLKINEDNLEKHMDWLAAIRKDIENELMQKTRSLKQKKISKYFTMVDNSQSGVSEEKTNAVPDLPTSLHRENSDLSMASTVILSKSNYNEDPNYIATFRETSSESSNASIKEITVTDGALTVISNPGSDNFSGFEDENMELTKFVDTQQKVSLVPGYSSSDSSSDCI